MNATPRKGQQARFVFDWRSGSAGRRINRSDHTQEAPSHEDRKSDSCHAPELHGNICPARASSLESMYEVRLGFAENTSKRPHLQFWSSGRPHRPHRWPDIKNMAATASQDIRGKPHVISNSTIYRSHPEMTDQSPGYRLASDHNRSTGISQGPTKQRYLEHSQSKKAEERDGWGDECRNITKGNAISLRILSKHTMDSKEVDPRSSR